MLVLTREQLTGLLVLISPSHTSLMVSGQQNVSSLSPKHYAQYLLVCILATGISKSGQTVSLQPPKESESSEIKGERKEECVKIGDSIADVMLRVPVQVGVKMEEGVVNLNLDQHGAK